MSEVLTREQADLMALAFIEANPGDCIGIIDSDEKMAAALVFIDLQRDGFLMSSASDNGPPGMSVSIVEYHRAEVPA